MWWIGCAALGLAGAQDHAPAAPGASREARALTLVQRLEQETPHAFWFARSTYVRREAEPEPLSSRWIPHVPIDCGNSMGGTFDERAAAGWAIELAAIYGLAMQRDVPALVGSVPGRVVFEAADPERRIALKLRGCSARGTFVEQGPEEEPSTELAADEAQALRTAGWRIHAVEVAEYPLMDGDEFTPTLSYLVGVSELLNEVTSGEDLALSGLLFARTAFHRLPDPQRVSGGVPELRRRPDGFLDLFLRERSVVRFAFPDAKSATAMVPLPRDASAERRAGWEAAARSIAEHFPASTTAGASVLSFEVYRTTAPPESSTLDQRLPSPVARLRLEQRDAKGQVQTCESASPRLFVPASLDLAQPFEVVIELEPAAYVFTDAVRLGCSDVARK